jgi:hypothetical protein
MTATSSTIYRPHPRYVLIAGIAALSVAALLWLLWRRLELGSVLFLAFAAGLLFFALRSLFSRIEVSDHGLVLLRPLSPPLAVQFRQLVEVSEEGRFQRVILLLYHPLAGQGLVDLDDLRSLALPALEEQGELLDLLLARTPPSHGTARTPNA